MYSALAYYFPYAWRPINTHWLAQATLLHVHVINCSFESVSRVKRTETSLCMPPCLSLLLYLLCCVDLCLSCSLDFPHMSDFFGNTNYKQWFLALFLLPHTCSLVCVLNSCLPFLLYNVEKMTATSTGLHTQQLKISKHFKYLWSWKY
jgi:hypothetical protein